MVSTYLELLTSPVVSKSCISACSYYFQYRTRSKFYQLRCCSILPRIYTKGRFAECIAQLFHDILVLHADLKGSRSPTALQILQDTENGKSHTVCIDINKATLPSSKSVVNPNRIGVSKKSFSGCLPMHDMPIVVIP
jgi:hypothetical protein